MGGEVRSCCVALGGSAFACILETSPGSPAALANSAGELPHLDIEIGSHLVAQDDLELTVAQAGLELMILLILETIILCSSSLFPF